MKQKTKNKYIIVCPNCKVHHNVSGQIEEFKISFFKKVEKIIKKEKGE